MQEQRIKEKVKERYGKVALTGNSESCCASTKRFLPIDSTVLLWLPYQAKNCRRYDGLTDQLLHVCSFT
jgi:hypothetical protein